MPPPEMRNQRRDISTKKGPGFKKYSGELHVGGGREDKQTAHSPKLTVPLRRALPGGSSRPSVPNRVQ